MRVVLTRFLFAAGIPAGLLMATFSLHAQLGRLPENVATLLPWLPYLLLVPSLAFAMLFNRGRAFFLLLILAAFYRLSTHPPAWEWRGVALDPEALQLGLAFLLPLNVAAFALLTERGIFTRHGLLRLAVLGLQAGILAVLATRFPAFIDGVLLTRPFGTGLATTAPLTQVVIAAFACSATVLAVRAALLRSPFELTLVGVLAALVVILYRATDPTTTALFSATAGLLILVGIVQESHRMAYRDDLTGLPGRRALQEELLKLGSRYAIAMLDVDHFKKFNDRHGHDVGDQVLKLVASKMEQVRGGGRPFRYGGEEFTVLFPGKGAEQVLPYLETLRKAVAGGAFQLRGKDRPQGKQPQRKDKKGAPKPRGAQSVSVTISIGVAERDDDHPLPMDVMKKADQALYLAKGAGRNRVCS